MRGSTAVAAALAACGGLAACASSRVNGSADAAPNGADAPDQPGVPDADVTPDASADQRSIAVDTFDQLTADVGTLTNATVESWGAVEPIAWYTGGLLQHGSDTGTFTNASSATWATVQTFPSTGKAAIQWSTQINWGNAIPPSVGLTGNEDWTMWDEGEIRLEAGTWTFALLPDDHGFVEIAAPGTTTFTRVVSADFPNEVSGSFVAATDGWYPFRYAYSNHAGASSIQLRLSGAAVALAPIPRDRLRVRADALAGMVEAAFDDSHDVGDVATTIDAVAPAYVDWGMGSPADLGLTSTDTFSVRWTGQLRIDLGGDYTFHYSTDDGQRLWIDGVEVLDAWLDTVQDETTTAITLAPGWHDLVIDHSENTSSAAAHLTVATGPDLAGLPLPPDRLRVVEARSERVAPGVNHTDVSIPDLATIQSTIAITAPAAAMVTSVDVSYEFNHGNWGDLVITLKAPDGTTYVTRNRAGAGTVGDAVERFSISALAGAPVAGVWTLLVQDAASGSTGTLLDFELTPHYAGGEPPIPTTASFESIVHDLGAVVGFDAITWTARVPAGAGLTVRLRTCAEAATCATADWSTPISASGVVPTIKPARYLQYRVDFTSDGDHAATLDALRIAYRIAGF